MKCGSASLLRPMLSLFQANPCRIGKPRVADPAQVDPDAEPIKINGYGSELVRFTFFLAIPSIVKERKPIYFVI